ncbi:Hypothetical protein, putative, partial [Bodo saltans]
SASSWDDAMKPLTSAEKYRQAFEDSRAKVHNDDQKKEGQVLPSEDIKNTLFADLCRDEEVEVVVRNLSPYEEALRSYTQDGQRDLAATIANYLNIRKERSPEQDNKILQPAKELPVGWEKYFQHGDENWTRLFVALNRILATPTEKAAKFEDIIAAYRNAGVKLPDLPEVERFFVSYYAPPEQDESEADDSCSETTSFDEEFAASLAIVEPRIPAAVQSPKNSLTITKDNSAAAFYPTSWETDGFTTSAMALEVIPQK